MRTDFRGIRTATWVHSGVGVGDLLSWNMKPEAEVGVDLEFYEYKDELGAFENLSEGKCKERLLV